MESIIQLIIPLLVIILTFVLGNRRRRTQGEIERETEENTMPEDEVAPPTFIEELQISDFTGESVWHAVEEPPTTEEPEAVAVQEPVEAPQPPPVPVESPAGIRSVPATALLDLSPRTFRQGIILREILGRPRAYRRGAPFQDRED